MVTKHSRCFYISRRRGHLSHPSLRVQCIINAQGRNVKREPNKRIRMFSNYRSINALFIIIGFNVKVN